MEKIQHIPVRLLGGPHDGRLVLYVIDFEFKGTMVVPIIEDQMPTGEGAQYDQMMGVDEDGRMLMSFTKMVSSISATYDPSVQKLLDQTPL